MAAPPDTAASVARRGTFGGVNVFLSRNLVPPEIFDALHDALRFNGANLFLCCDPSHSAADEFHVISSIDHEKFDDLRAKGCNLIGPQCVFSCVKERRPLPKRGYTCCLAMDGVTVLASGFQKEEKVKIEQFVTAMGGTLFTKGSLDVNFVIAKNVLSAKYKWALNVLKKPVVSMSWLHQCWTEHRLVPHEPYKILPFTGLTICVTKITLDERKEMEKQIVQNGGRYSADLTRKCTHLISEFAEGDKYKVARQWGHIHLVSRRWFDLSIARRACLGEEFYPVSGTSVSQNVKKAPQKEQASRPHTSQTAPATELEDLEPTPSQNFSQSSSDAAKIFNHDADVSIQQTKDENINATSVAEDSESEDNDLYLSNCRISVVGFGEQEQRNLIILIRKGGGSRYMQLSEKLTHIVVGAPSEMEKKEVRRLAAWGIINVVKATWLQECDFAKKEVPVSIRHIVSELVPSRGFMCPKMETSNDGYSNKRSRNSSVVSIGELGTVAEDRDYEALSLEKRRGNDRCQNGSSSCFADLPTQSQSSSFNISNGAKAGSKLQNSSANVDNQNRCSEVFQRRSFCFSRLFPAEGKAEVVEWVRRGGGVMVDCLEMGADFVIGGHGLTELPSEESACSIVSLHWIRFCLEEGCMQDIGSHILFTPLGCSIPFHGFEGFWFCFSYYEEKEKILLKNICRTLGAKITEKLSRKVTHLVCKFNDGPKYDFACKWGIPTVTAEWLIECIKEDKIVPLEPFQPKPVTSQDREAGLCTVSQHPTQAARLVLGLDQSQLPSDFQRQKEDPKQNIECSDVLGKRSRLLNSEVDSKDRPNESCLRHSNVVPDVADAIEDLLAQSNKMQDVKSPGTSACGQTIFPPDHSIIGHDHASSHPGFGITRNWLSRSQKQDTILNNSSQDKKEGNFYAFSETQTDSQVVGYEEDLSGRQKIIDRVRSQSTAPISDK